MHVGSTYVSVVSCDVAEERPSARANVANRVTSLHAYCCLCQTLCGGTYTHPTTDTNPPFLCNRCALVQAAPAAAEAFKQRLAANA
jgi:hypothetical protein